MIDNEVKIFAKEKEKCCATNFLFTGSMLNRVKIQEKETNLNETMRVFFIPLRSAGYRGKCSSLKSILKNLTVID
ncbi:hypothetical protein [Escherichia coli]|uniref:hypothetical protein n=1 Tax=Escherichia coli TaxID=562 RepID=UPI003981FB24